MKVSIYSREEIEKLISKGFPEKTAVISFYDPPNIRTGEISEPVDYKGLPERVFQVEVHDKVRFSYKRRDGNIGRFWFVV